MSPLVRIGAAALAIGAGFSSGTALGRVVGPVDLPGGAETGDHAGHDMAAMPGGGHHSLEMSGPGGLLVSQSGYTLQPQTTVLSGAADEQFQFQILGADGAAVHDFEAHYERLLHLVVVSRDLATYFHVHPVLGPDGTWTVALPALAPGAYHAFASFVVADGPSLTLSVGLLVPGDTAVNPLPEPGPFAMVDGYVVALTGAPLAATPTGVTFTVQKDGIDVTDLVPYLGSAGHLVAIRAGDLAYTHVHPAADNAGPTVPVLLEVPSPGDYRLFFDFAHGGAVHTAAFTIHVPATTLGTASPDPSESSGSPP